MGNKRFNPGYSALERFGQDLTLSAKNDKLDPVIGRDDQKKELMEVLCRRRKNNAVLLGEPGVGKTAVAEGLAQKIADGEVPVRLMFKRIISLDLTLMIAGTRYRGEFESRLRRVIDEAKANPNIILLIDEMHTLIGAGSAEGAMDAANILKPPLARGELQCIGATTQDEYKRYVEKDAALQRRFQPISVPEPTIDESIEILSGLRKSYELYHTVEYTQGAIEAAAKYSDQFLPDRFLPDKAIDLVDQAGARANLDFGAYNEEARHIEFERDAIRYLYHLKNDALRLGQISAIEPLHELEDAWRAQLLRLIHFNAELLKKREQDENDTKTKNQTQSENQLQEQKKKKKKQQAEKTKKKLKAESKNETDQQETNIEEKNNGSKETNPNLVIKIVRDIVFRDEKLEDYYDHYHNYLLSPRRKPLIPRDFPTPVSLFKALDPDFEKNISDETNFILTGGDFQKADAELRSEHIDPDEIIKRVRERYSFLDKRNLEIRERGQIKDNEDMDEIMEHDETEAEQIKKLNERLQEFLQDKQAESESKEPYNPKLTPLLNREVLEFINSNSTFKTPKYIFERICNELGNPEIVEEMRNPSEYDTPDVKEAIKQGERPGKPKVTKNCIGELIASQTGIPITDITQDESLKLQNLENTLHERVIGQHEAVVAISSAVRRARVGVRNPNRPIASFMFCGPTGVGKTELTKTLAAQMFGSDDAVIRLDMSEYMERHTVAQLLGAPPGYIGYTEGGQLTEKVRRKPYSVVLFDEIEKAHPDILDILLQLLDDGRLTDSQGE